MAERFIQLKRNKNLFLNRTAAFQVVDAPNFLTDKKDGEVIVARYKVDSSKPATQDNLAVIVGHVVKNSEVECIVFDDLRALEQAVGIEHNGDTIINYVSGTTYISGDTNIIDALIDLDVILNELSGKTVENYLSGVSIDNLQSEVEVTNHVANIKIGANFITTEYPTPFDEVASPIETTLSIEDAFTNVEKTISALSQEVIYDEMVTEKAIEALVDAAGFNADPIEYYVNPNKKYISGSTNIKEALEDLNDAIENHKMLSSVKFPLFYNDANEELELKIANVTDTIAPTADTEASHNNIIKTYNGGGLYAFADLHYEAATNVLKFVNTNGTREIKLTGISFISGMRYDKAQNALIIDFQKPDGTTGSTDPISLTDLINEYEFVDSSETGATKASSTQHNVSLVADPSAQPTGSTKVYGEISIFDCGTYGD